MLFLNYVLILLGFVALDILWWRVADRRLLAMRRRWLWRALLAGFIGAMFCYLAMSLLRPNALRTSQGPVPMGVHAVVYLWHFIVLPVMVLRIGIAALWKRVRASRQKRAWTLSSRTAPANLAPSTTIATPSRRQVLAAMAVAAPPLAACALGAGSLAQMRGRRLQSYNLRIAGLPAALDGMTIAHVSDTHIGKFLHPDRLPAIADDINALDADFIVFTGDLIDLGLDDLGFGIDFLRRLKARYGLAICEGNHDLMQNRGEFEWRLRDAGLPLLLSDERTVPFAPRFARKGEHYAVQFLGLPWNNYDAHMAESVDYLRPRRRDGAFPILLAHHPHAFDPAAAAGFPLTLSGHTHGGQLMLTNRIGAGPIRFRYVSGLYQKPAESGRAASQLIVNNGIGNWFPLRLNAPAEIVRITLHGGPALDSLS